MPQGRVHSFDDPDRFQATFRAGSYELLDLPKGRFHAELTHVDFSRLQLQRSDRNGLVSVRSTSLKQRVSIMFLADRDQASPRRNGMEMSADDVSVHRPSATNHLLAPGPSRFSMMSLDSGALAAAGDTILGRPIEAPLQTHLIRPAPGKLARLRALHEGACRLARTKPDAFGRSSAVQALEQDMIVAMVECLAGQDSDKAQRTGGSHARVMRRFEEFLAARRLEPVYLVEICAAIGVSERTLRTSCQDHLGMAPIHYLWLRRMNLAHRALLRADPACATVTDIATEHGFWELGRFSVEYRALFGESPSVSLRRASPS